MIQPYQTIGLVPTMRGIRHRDEIIVNLERPVYPKNLYLNRAPYNHGDYRREVIDKQVRLMHDRDIWARPDDGTGA